MGDRAWALECFLGLGYEGRARARARQLDWRQDTATGGARLGRLWGGGGE